MFLDHDHADAGMLLLAANNCSPSPRHHGDHSGSGGAASRRGNGTGGDGSGGEAHSTSGAALGRTSGNANANAEPGSHDGGNNGSGSGHDSATRAGSGCGALSNAALRKNASAHNLLASVAPAADAGAPQLSTAEQLLLPVDGDACAAAGCRNTWPQHRGSGELGVNNSVHGRARGRGQADASALFTVLHSGGPERSSYPLDAFACGNGGGHAPQYEDGAPVATPDDRTREAAGGSAAGSLRGGGAAGQSPSDTSNHLSGHKRRARTAASGGAAAAAGSARPASRRHFGYPGGGAYLRAGGSARLSGSGGGRGAGAGRAQRSHHGESAALGMGLHDKVRPFV